MLNFLKENSNNIVKLAVNQIAMTIFGLLLSAAALKSKNMFWITGALSILFYLYLIYVTAWDIGARDKIRIDGGRMKKDKFKGLYLSIAANSVNILLALITIICYYVSVLTKWEWSAGIMAISHNISLLLNGMYNAVLSLFELGQIRFWLMLVAVLPALLTTALAYIAGTHNYRIWGFLGLGKHKKH